ncbi:MAG TPA: DNA gyrase inhibitor YacG [Chromatiales bacterium]|nr:DNA gyrase inhibitor YacG [Chromatiales bacterium]
MNVNCPTCKKPVDWSTARWRPFCSERCRMIDFGKWSDEEHRIPGSPQPSSEEIRTFDEH